MPSEPYVSPHEIRSVAVIGTGSVGSSWSALFLARGIEVIAYDPGQDAEPRIRDFIAKAWPALRQLGLAKDEHAPLERLHFVKSPTAAARSADLVQENVPETPELKAVVLREIDAAADPAKIILSSTGGIMPSTLQASCKHPQRLVVVHPYNPPHLMPLVEVVGGRQTDPEVVDWAMEFARLLGKQPIRLNREATGHMTNRLQFALVREAVACLLDGTASARDIDAAVRYGLGPRWTLMGSLLTLHLAGGPGGMKHALDYNGAAIEAWWTPSPQPRLSAEVKAKLVEAAEEVSGGAVVADWIQWRDKNLVEVLKLQQAGEKLAPRHD